MHTSRINSTSCIFPLLSLKYTPFFISECDRMRDRYTMAANHRSAAPHYGAGASADRLPAESSRSSLFGGGSGRGVASAASNRGALEEDNEMSMSTLEQKVAALKSATMAVHDEVQDHNRMLGGMGDDFDRTGGVMSGTLRKLEGLVRTGGAGSPFCKLVLGVVVVFLILWFVSRQL